MDYVLLIAGFVCLIIGLIGCIIPAVPGPPISWIGMLLLKFTGKYSETISIEWLVIWAVVVVAVTVADFILPAMITKKMGGSKAGAVGATIGTFAGLFFLPWGVLFGPFFGALIGELIHGVKGRQMWKSAFASFLGFLFSTGIKLICCLIMTVHYIKNVINEII
jgi:uncharacterized protein YqgC (DUF456 family)